MKVEYRGVLGLWTPATIKSINGRYVRLENGVEIQVNTVDWRPATWAILATKQPYGPMSFRTTPTIEERVAPT
jgi:hypothetical protein